MKKLSFLIVAVFVMSGTLKAQDKKWSVEANFPISVGDDLGNDVSGIIDLGVKYRFLDLKVVKIGVGINTGVFKGNVKNFTIQATTDFDETDLIIQPKVFAEFNVPGIKKLHPSIGLGYTVVKSKTKGLFLGQNQTSTGSDGGFNLNLGVSYDISQKFFLQVQYDYIRHSIRHDDFDFGIDQNLGYLKAGVGFRF